MPKFSRKLAGGVAIAFAIVETAQASESAISPADTGFMIAATALVLMMTIPGLALFYAGMVRKKNVLATMVHAASSFFFNSSGTLDSPMPSRS